MVAKILFVLALLLAITYAQLPCRPQRCVNTNSDCDYLPNVPTNASLTDRIRRCKYDAFCKVANTTTDLVGKCEARLDVGGACNLNSDCKAGMACVNKFCNRGYLPGAKCKVPNDCLYIGENGDNTAACTLGKCAGVAVNAKCRRGSRQSCLPPNYCGTEGNCVPQVGGGATCASNNDCQRGFFCHDDKTCTAISAAGATCDVKYRGDNCPYNYLCVPNTQTGNATCREAFTAARGIICIDVTDCQKGLTCLAKPQNDANFNFGSCGVFVKSTMRSCNASAPLTNNVECNQNELCSCNANSGGGKCYTRESGLTVTGSAKKSFSDANKCINNCQRTDWDCLGKCQGKVCSYIRKSVSGEKGFDDLGLDCADGPTILPIYPGYLQCSAGSFVQLSVLGLVSVIAALLL